MSIGHRLQTMLAEMRMKMRQQWILKTKQGNFRDIAGKYGISPITAKCMINRGVCEEDDIDIYLNGGVEKLASPWQMKDMDKAVEIIRENQGRRAAIASDYDCDGICSAMILKKGFERCGIPADIFTPNRIREGYGLNIRIVDEALAGGVSFLITCDNGIAANEAITYAKEKGMTVIVTDHHEVQEELPPADAVVDPKQADCPYPFQGLCGAGVAFQLISALYEKMGLEASLRQEFLEYVAIATVADVMELQGENRILVKEGLKRLQSTKNIGLHALLEVLELDRKELKAHHIGFRIGPCMNAPGRIDDVSKVFRLLEEDDAGRAFALAEELKEINDKRKQMTEEAAERAFQILEQEEDPGRAVYVLLLPDCHQSIVGIVAGRLRETFHHPVLVFTTVGDGLVKGSGRSVDAYDMFRHLMECRDLMVYFGGHKKAAGMTLREKDLPELERRLNENAGLTEADFIPQLDIDVALPVGYLSEPLISDLEKLEPFGNGNPRPIFGEQHFRVLQAAKRGEHAKVLSMKVANAAGTVIQAVCFDRVEEFEQMICECFGSEELEKMYRGRENRIDIGLAYHPSVNEYRGFRTIEIVIDDFCRISE